MNVARMSKGIGLILTADVNRKIFMRAPLDCVQIGQLLGCN
jgi:hypothetical protein